MSNTKPIICKPIKYQIYQIPNLTFTNISNNKYIKQEVKGPLWAQLLGGDPSGLLDFFTPFGRSGRVTHATEQRLDSALEKSKKNHREIPEQSKRNTEITEKSQNNRKEIQKIQNFTKNQNLMKIWFFLQKSPPKLLKFDFFSFSKIQHTTK